MVILGFVIGVVVGTAIAVLLDRLYTGAPWRGPILACSGCGCEAPRVAWLGLPGYLALRRRCASCGTKLPARLAYLPVLGGAVFAVAFALTSGVHLLLVLLFLPALLSLTAADFERRLLPNRVMYPTIVVALLVSWAWPDRNAFQSVAGGALGFGVVFVIFMVLPGLGFGDVKLAGLLGLLAGVSRVMPALMFAAIAAGVAGIALLITRKVSLKGTIAYGPYLALGAFVAMLAG
jgi:leader peptidase (prepilin peptidase)/N-methyltransferase